MDLNLLLSIWNIEFLVISCPCALGLPHLRQYGGILKRGSKWYLIKIREALETANYINTVVLDKTERFTEGTPSVTNLYLEMESTKLEYCPIEDP